MAIAAVLPRKMISFTPALWNTLLALVTALMVAVVAIGQYLAGRQKGWQDLAESQSKKIDFLQDDHAQAVARGESEREVLRKQLAETIALHARDQEVQTLRIEALEAQVAQAQRINHILQNKVDALEKQNGIRHQPRKSKKTTD